jgi:hypothetical protein
MRVRRVGLLRKQDPALRKPSPASLRTDRLMERLHAAKAKDFIWKETWQEFARLSNNEPDIYGRRIFTPLATDKAAYVAKVCHRAYLRGVLPMGRSWSYLSGAIRMIFHELEQSP